MEGGWKWDNPGSGHKAGHREAVSCGQNPFCPQGLNSKDEPDRPKV